MYILSDNFMGNIRNNSTSYLEGCNFHYTNDGKSFKKCEIASIHIRDGVLTKFFGEITVYPWMSHKLKSSLSNFIYQESIYVQIEIDKDNNINNVSIVREDLVDKQCLVKLHEVVFPKYKNANTTIFSAGHTSNLIAIDEKQDDNFNLGFVASICFPDMVYRDDLEQYVFKNVQIFSYSSDHQISKVI